MNPISSAQLDQALSPQRLAGMNRKIILTQSNLGLFLLLGFILLAFSPQLADASSARDSLRILTLFNPLAVILVLLRFYRSRAKRFEPQSRELWFSGKLCDRQGRVIQLSPAEILAETLCHDQVQEARARSNASFLGLVAFVLGAWTGVLQDQLFYLLNLLPALLLSSQLWAKWPTRARLLQLGELWQK